MPVQVYGGFGRDAGLVALARDAVVRGRGRRCLPTHPNVFDRVCKVIMTSS
jgi:hypothetical protein